MHISIISKILATTTTNGITLTLGCHLLRKVKVASLPLPALRWWHVFWVLVSQKCLWVSLNTELLIFTDEKKYLHTLQLRKRALNVLKETHLEGGERERETTNFLALPGPSLSVQQQQKQFRATGKSGATDRVAGGASPPPKTAGFQDTASGLNPGLPMVCP